MEKRDKPSGDAELKRRVEELIAYKGGGHNPDLVEDVVENALKLLHDVEDRGDVRVIQTAIRELRYAFKLFAPYANTRKVTIFGSARTQPSKTEYKQAVEFARKIADAGFMVITGAGPGIMQAGHEGAGPEKSFGANIRLPWEQAANPIIQHNKKLITFKYFFTRKLIFLRHSDAIVLFPGGFGTMDEGYEALKLMLDLVTARGEDRVMIEARQDAPIMTAVPSPKSVRAARRSRASGNLDPANEPPMKSRTAFGSRTDATGSLFSSRGARYRPFFSSIGVQYS